MPVLFCSMVFSLMTILMTFHAIKLYQVYEFKTVLQIAAACLLAGSWVRSFAPVVDSFWPIVLGQTIASVGHVMTQQAQNILVNRWFGDKERALAVAISVAGLPFGSLIGLVSTGLSFANASNPKGQLNELIFGQNVAITCLFCLFCITFKSRPDYPPSAVALKESVQGNFVSEAHKLLANKNFVLIAIIFSLAMSQQNTFGILVDSLFSPFGMDSTDFAVIGGAVIGLGLFSALAVGMLLDKTHKYKASIIFICGAMVPIFIYFNVFLLDEYLADKSPLVMYICCLLYGVIAVPIIPTCMSFAAEVTFPMQASVFTGLMLFSQQSCTFLLSSIGALILDADVTGLSTDEATELKMCNSRKFMWFYFFLYSCQFFIAFWIKEDLRRLKFGMAHSKVEKDEEYTSINSAGQPAVTPALS
jgi:hypothetical protein